MVSISNGSSPEILEEIQKNFQGRYFVEEMIQKFIHKGSVDLQPDKIQEIWKMAEQDVARHPSFDFTKKIATHLVEKIGVLNSGFLQIDQKKIFQFFLDHIRPYYETQFQTLEKRDISNGALDEFLSAIINDLVSKAFSFSSPILNSPPSWVSNSFHFLQEIFQGQVPFPQAITQTEPLFKEVEKAKIEEFEQESGQKASSFEEVAHIHGKQSVEEFAKIFLKENGSNFTARLFLEKLFRNPFTSSFYRCVADDITHQRKSSVMQIMDVLIKDYISKEPSLFWHHSAALNYEYAVEQIESLVMDHQTLPQTKKMRCRYEAATEIMLYFEEMVDCFIKFQKAIESLQDYLPILLFGDSEAFLKVAEGHASSQEPDLSQISAQVGFLTAVVKKAVQNDKKADSILTFLKMRLKCIHLIQRFPSQQELHLELSPEQESVLKHVNEIFTSSVADCFSKLKILQQARDPSQKQTGLPLLGIGFSGPLFDEESTSSKNRLFLNFSATMRTQKGQVRGSPLLYAVKSLFELRAKEKEFEIEVLEGAELEDLNVFSYISRFIIDFICRSPQELIHSDFFNMFQKALLDRFESAKSELLNQQSSAKKKIATAIQQFQELTAQTGKIENYIKLYQIQLAQSEDRTTEDRVKIRNRWLSGWKRVGKMKKKKMPDMQKEESRLKKIEERLAKCEAAIKLIAAKEFSQLDNETVEWIHEIIDQGKPRVCVETVISRFAGNPYTLSFAMGKEMCDPILVGKEPFCLGKGRTLVKPCITRCQLFSAAHMFWGELNHMPTAQQAHERDQNRGGKGISPLFSSRDRRSSPEKDRGIISSSTEQENSHSSKPRPPSKAMIENLLKFQDSLNEKLSSGQITSDLQTRIKKTEELLANFLSQQDHEYIFQLNEHHYQLRFTLGEGSCALHALIGEEIDGTFRYPGDKESSSVRAKVAFKEALKKVLDDQGEIFHQHRFKTVLKRYLNESLKNTNDASALRLFTNNPEGDRLREEWQKITSFYQDVIEKNKNEEAAIWANLIQEETSPILDAIMDHINGNPTDKFYGKSKEEMLKIFLETPREILDIVATKESDFLPLIDSPQVTNLRRQRNNIIDKIWPGAEDVFLLSEPLINHYLTTIEDPDFYLNTQEIILAAHLFEKQVLIVSLQDGSIAPAEELINSEGKELIVIYHRSNHFSRCIRL